MLSGGMRHGVKFFILTIALFPLCLRAEAGHGFVDLEGSGATDKTRGAYLAAGVSPLAGLLLNLEASYQQTGKNPMGYSLRLSAAFGLGPITDARVSGFANWGGNYRSIGAGVALQWRLNQAWGLETQTLLTTSVESARLAQLQGGGKESIAFQHVLSASLDQGIVRGLALQGSFTYFLYGDEYGGLTDIPTLVVQPTMQQLAPTLAGMPYDTITAGLTIQPARFLSIALQVLSVHTSLTARRMPGGSARLSFAVGDHLALNIRAGAVWPVAISGPSPNPVLSYGAGLAVNW